MCKLLLNTAYFPPVHYFFRIKQHTDVTIEQYEHYGKQSYRNRCEIMSANGVMPLSIPIKKASTPKFFTKDARVDYDVNWQKIHFKAIESAYKNSPFYDYYMDDYMEVFKNKEVFLLDLNTKILHTVLEHIGINKEIGYSEDYISATEGYCDMRDAIHPKSSKRMIEDSEFIPKPYQQTFCDRFPFTPNLSIIDLLFNTGPEAKLFL